MNDVMGGSKIDVALDGLRSMLEANAEAYHDLKVEEAVILIELSFDRDRENGSSQGKMIFSCSDHRGWVQEAFFRQAADMIFNGQTLLASEDDDE